jgi:hypothetical protein
VYAKFFKHQLVETKAGAWRLEEQLVEAQGVDYLTTQEVKHLETQGLEQTKTNTKT